MHHEGSYDARMFCINVSMMVVIFILTLQDVTTVGSWVKGARDISVLFPSACKSK